MILLDTDHFSVVTDSRDVLHAPLIARLHGANESLALPIVSVEEQLRGWLKLVHSGTNVAKQVIPYDRLARLIETVAQWELARFGMPAAEEFTSLRKQRIRIGTQDLKIAAIAKVNDALLLSANLVDFQKVPGLRVEDWLHGK